jgi:hypothetical protein
MRHHILPLALVLLLCGCNRPRTATPSQSEHRGLVQCERTTLGGSQHETYRQQRNDHRCRNLHRHPKQGTEARYLDIKSGDVVLGDVKQEIRPGETAIFDQLILNPDAPARIDSQGPHILMDVYSGRRSSKDNLLDCDDYDGGFESIRGRTIVIRCQLIEERFPRSGS